MRSYNNFRIHERFNNLAFKMFLSTFKPNGYFHTYTNSPKDFFLSYLGAYIIPKYLDIRTPAQIVFNNTLITTLGYQDLEMIDAFKSIALVKRKRIIRALEESYDQRSPLAYKEIAFLTFSTTNTVYKWINDTQVCGYSVTPGKNNNVPTRKSDIVRLYIEDKLLSRFAGKEDTLLANYADHYAPLSEIIWFFAEFLLACTVYIHKNNTAEEILSRLKVSVQQYEQFINIYQDYRHIIDSKYESFFIQSFTLDNPISLIALAIISAADFIGTCDDIEDVINGLISFYRLYTPINEPMSVLLNLKDASVHKQQIYYSEVILKPVKLKLYNEGIYNNFNGASNKELIQQTVLSLKRQAQEAETHITENDIAFIMGISRDLVQKYQSKE